jgi:tetrahydromethanopterin S-methyltransferase subunit F
LSNAKQPEPETDELAVIGAAAEAAESAVESKDSKQRFAELEARLAGIEPLLEQLQANSKIGPMLSRYVEDLEEEQRFFNRARYWVGGFAAASVVGLIVLLLLAIFCSSSPLFKSPPVAIATFVIGLVSGIVFLISAFAKGVFRSTAERHSDGFLPPALEKSIDVLGKISGKS